MEQNEKETIGVKNEGNVVSTPQTTQESHEEIAKKLKKQRTRQIVASLIGIAILAFGLWKIVCLFFNPILKLLYIVQPVTESLCKRNACFLKQLQ